MAETDRDLVAAIARGDEEAFRLLFRRYTPRLYALALRLLAGRAADADDAVQECWTRAAVRLPTFEWRSALSTWLSGILINCVREVRRSTPPASDTLPDDLTLPTTSAGAALDLERAIAGLPDGYREVLVLHDVEGYTHREIGELLAISAGTSKSQLFQARRAMRARLSAHPIKVEDHAGRTTDPR